MSESLRASAADLYHATRNAPVIASVKDALALDIALASSAEVIFLMYGTLLDLEETVARIRDAGRTVFVDVDLLDGLAGGPVIIDLVASSRADGILSARTATVKAAKQRQLTAGHRFQLVDTRTYRSIPGRVASSGADFVEAQPGCLPRIIAYLREEVNVPIVAGGLIFDRADINAALDSGAAAVATSNASFWG